MDPTGRALIILSPDFNSIKMNTGTYNELGEPIQTTFYPNGKPKELSDGDKLGIVIMGSIASGGSGVLAKVPAWIKDLGTVATVGGKASKELEKQSTRSYNEAKPAKNSNLQNNNNFFKDSHYSDKVTKQMEDPNDPFHSFPRSVDGYADKFGVMKDKIGGDGQTYRLLEVEGTYGGRSGIFEYMKDKSGEINHRFFKTK